MTPLARRIREILFPVKPRESESLSDLREWVGSARARGSHDRFAELLLETYDSLWSTQRRLYRSIIENRVLYGLAIALAVFCAVLTTDVKDLQHQQQDGRRVSIGVTCAVLGSITEGGKEVISATARGTLNPKLERSLEKMGYPPPSVRERRADAAGGHYVSSIASAVQKQTGVTHLVRKDGSINCTRLRSLAKVSDRTP